MQDDFALPKPTDAAPADRLLELYVAGECTLAEQAAMERWISANPDRGRAMRAMRVAGMVEATSRHPDIDADATARRIAEHRSLTAGIANRGRARLIVGRTGRWPLWTIAAAIAMVSIGMLWRRGSDETATPPSAQLTRYSTGIGQQATVMLRDGSQIRLAPSSIVQIAPDYGTTSRTIVLDGEGSFDVTARSNAPFIVRTGHTVTRVLGTRFAVRHYSTDPGVRVAVASGKVVVTETTARPRSSAQSLTLTAGMVGDVTDSIARSAAATDIDEYLGWTTGHLVFREEPVTDVLATLSRWYGYTFVLADSSLAPVKVTVRLDTQASSAALSTLKLVLNVDMSFNGNVVTLRPRQAPLPQHRPDPRSTLSREVGR